MSPRPMEKRLLVSLRVAVSFQSGQTMSLDRYINPTCSAQPLHPLLIRSWDIHSSADSDEQLHGLEEISSMTSPASRPGFPSSSVARRLFSSSVLSSCVRGRELGSTAMLSQIFH